MKKKVISLAIMLIMVASIAVLALSACNPDDITHFRLDLNDKDADYTEEYRTANGIESRNIVKIVNKDLYKNFSTGLPKGSDMVAPSGKVFAGWYFDNKSYEGTEFSEYNWNRFQRDAADEDKRYVLYARWIPQGQQIIYFDLANAKADFKPEYRASHNNFDHRTPEFVINNDLAQKAFSMPQEANLVVPSDVTFDGWYFVDGTEFNAVNFVEKANAGEVQMRVVAHWIEKPKAYVYFSFPAEEPGSGRYFQFKNGQGGSVQVLREDCSELFDLLPKKDSIIYNKYDVDLGTSVQYDDGEEFETFEWRIAVYDENYELVTTLELNQANWLIATADLDEYGSVYLILQYTLKPEYEPNLTIE